MLCFLFQLMEWRIHSVFSTTYFWTISAKERAQHHGSIQFWLELLCVQVWISVTHIYFNDITCWCLTLYAMIMRVLNSGMFIVNRRIIDVYCENRFTRVWPKTSVAIRHGYLKMCYELWKHYVGKSLFNVYN